MTDLQAYEVELEKAVVATKSADEQFRAANARLAIVTRGMQLSNTNFQRAIKELAVAERAISEKYIAWVCGEGNAIKPEAAPLTKLRTERDLAELALAHCRTEFPKARSGALEAEAVLCDKQASIKFAQSLIEREHGLKAFAAIAEDFGAGASLEIRGSKWQQLQEDGDRLIAVSRSLRLQAEQALGG